MKREDVIRGLEDLQVHGCPLEHVETLRAALALIQPAGTEQVETLRSRIDLLCPRCALQSDMRALFDKALGALATEAVPADGNARDRELLRAFLDWGGWDYNDAPEKFLASLAYERLGKGKRP